MHNWIIISAYFSHKNRFRFSNICHLYTRKKERISKMKTGSVFLQLYLSLTVCRKQANANKQDVFSLKRLNLSKQFSQIGERKKIENCLEIRWQNTNQISISTFFFRKRTPTLSIWCVFFYLIIIVVFPVSAWMLSYNTVLVSHCTQVRPWGNDSFLFASICTGERRSISCGLQTHKYLFEHGYVYIPRALYKWFYEFVLCPHW